MMNIKYTKYSSYNEDIDICIHPHSPKYFLLHPRESSFPKGNYEILRLTSLCPTCDALREDL